MAKAARGLGKGLDSLIPAAVPKAEPVETETKKKKMRRELMSRLQR